jgi:hypothetical protein
MLNERFLPQRQFPPDPQATKTRNKVFLSVWLDFWQNYRGRRIALGAACRLYNATRASESFSTAPSPPLSIV